MTSPDSTCVVTGAGSGIGESIAERFAAAGANVVLMGRTAEKLDAVAARIRDAGGHATPICVELSDPQDVERAMAKAAGLRGEINVIVNSAGIYREGPFAEISDSTIDELIDTNVKGLMRATRAALRCMPPGGCIINIGSMSGVRPLDAQSVYAATKAAVIHFGTCLARELAPRGIRVNTVSPGPAKTPLIYTVVPEDRVPQVEAWLAGRIPLGRLVEPSEVADAVTYLAGARSATGAHLVLDGGTVL